MTYTRNTPASESAATGVTPTGDSSRSQRSGRSQLTKSSRGTRHPRQAKPSGRPRTRDRTTLPADGYTGRAYRARAEPMAVRPLRDGRYVVESEGGTYVVDAARATCTCPDNAIRGARCKHVRRVTVEIRLGIVPAPDEREGVCAVCGGRAFVPIDERAPVLCDAHDHEPGDLVRDRETGSLLVVVERIGERADEARTRAGRVVADYETNANYGGHEPVFAAAYVARLPPGSDRRRRLGAVDDEPRYLFPASRLASVESDDERDDRSAASASDSVDRSPVID